MPQIKGKWQGDAKMTSTQWEQGRVKKQHKAVKDKREVFNYSETELKYCSIKNKVFVKTLFMTLNITHFLVTKALITQQNVPKGDG